MNNPTIEKVSNEVLTEWRLKIRKRKGKFATGIGISRVTLNKALDKGEASVTTAHLINKFLKTHKAKLLNN